MSVSACLSVICVCASVCMDVVSVRRGMDVSVCLCVFVSVCIIVRACSVSLDGDYV